MYKVLSSPSSHSDITAMLHAFYYQTRTKFTHWVYCLYLLAYYINAEPFMPFITKHDPSSHAEYIAFPCWCGKICFRRCQWYILMFTLLTDHYKLVTWSIDLWCGSMWQLTVDSSHVWLQIKNLRKRFLVKYTWDNSANLTHNLVVYLATCGNHHKSLFSLGHVLFGREIISYYHIAKPVNGEMISGQGKLKTKVTWLQSCESCLQRWNEKLQLG